MTVSLLGPIAQLHISVVSDIPDRDTVSRIFLLHPGIRSREWALPTILGRPVPDPPDEPMKAVSVDRDGSSPQTVILTLGDVGNAAAAGALVGRSATTDAVLDVPLPKMAAPTLRQFIVGMAAGVHGARRSEPGPQIRVWVRPDQLRLVEEGLGVGRNILLARDLANEPSNNKTPDWLADRAHDLADRRLHVTTWRETDLRERGFGGVLAVGAGSAHEPNVTFMRYRGAPSAPSIVLVGKGITFDSGGLSLKPPPSMPLMKTDMTGAAAVIGTLAAARDLGLPVNVTGILACAENMPSGSAARPGDVVRHVNGRTSEILNTDAEGRLVLADCLAYAATRLRPDYLIDVASLTGAATIGLGRQHAALYSRDDRLAATLTDAGVRSGDAVWRMPLVDDYREAIDSDIADAANTNTDAHVQAGSITAALFLEPFSGSTRWAHLDIAGAARTESDRPSARKGATGYGVSLLTYWLARLARQAW